MSSKVFTIVFVLVLTSQTRRSVSTSNVTWTVNKFGYAVYEPGWSLINDGSLEVWFKTEKRDTLLLYEDVGGQGEFIDVFLIEGKLRMRLAIGDCSYDERTINGTFNDLQWHKILISKKKENTTLSIDDITASKFKCSAQLQPMVALYTGYLSLDARYSAQNSVNWAFPTAFWESMEFRFQGCLKDIIYTERGLVTRPRLRKTKLTSPGCNNACRQMKCRHRGRCIDRIHTAVCDCEGTGYHGKHCARVIPKTTSTPVSTYSERPMTTSTSVTLTTTQKRGDQLVIAKARKKASGVCHGASFWAIILPIIFSVSMSCSL